MTSRLRRAALGLGAALVLAAMPAASGLLDSPPPTFSSGQVGMVVYRMGPIYFEPGWADTVVSCEHAGDAPLELAFEVFDANDQPAGQLATARLAPGGRVVFVTSREADPAGVVVEGLPKLQSGKARISATSARISCEGHIRVRSNDGTIREASLELLKRVTR
jgi:hypothetical protein